MVEKNSEMLFEKFEIIECLKKDDHAAVYIANHIYLNKKIILKILNTQDLSDDSILHRFKREAKLLAQLNHPNIIKVLDFGTYENYFYISFEYFESKNLRVHIRKDELTAEQKKHLVLQLFKGLSYAHDHNIIHRDLKPENILVADDLTLKIGDFGLAISATENYVTSQDSIVGTPCYMSPEQVRGNKLTNKSDLFSSGLVIYELYSGKNPFIGKDVSETINNVNSFDEKALHKEMLEFPLEIHEILVKMIVKDIEKRIGSAREVLELLGAKDEISILPVAAKKMGGKTGALLLVSAILLIIGAGFAYILYKNVNISQNTGIEQGGMQKSVQNKQFSGGLISSSSNTLKEKNYEGKSSNEQTPDDIHSSGVIEKKIDSQKIIGYGKLAIECNPWADVYIDSLKAETTPLSGDLRISEGEHMIRLIHPNYPVFAQKVSIFDSKKVMIKVNLDTLFGFLECNVHPWSEIYINGDFKGETPLQSAIRLIPGTYRITLKNKKFSDVVKVVKIEKNRICTLNYNFEKKEND